MITYEMLIKVSLKSGLSLGMT